MNKPLPPEMNCEPLPYFDLDDWTSIQRAFAPLPAWNFRQTWLRSPPPLLSGATVRVGTWADVLVVYAELADKDIFNPVTKFNEVAFTHGDAFEMFLRPEGQDAYYEFHVTPLNQKLQLRFESGDVFRSLAAYYGKNALQHCKIHKPLFESRIEICAQAGCWRVVVVIPFSSVVESDLPSARLRWRFSASRYDYTRGKSKPVLSSTSAHTVCDFHRQSEWGMLHLMTSPMTASFRVADSVSQQPSVRGHKSARAPKSNVGARTEPGLD